VITKCNFISGIIHYAYEKSPTFVFRRARVQISARRSYSVRLVAAFLKTLQQPDRTVHQIFVTTLGLNTSFQHHYSVTNRDSDCDCLASESFGAYSYETEPFAHQHVPSNEYLRAPHPGYDITRTQGTPKFAVS
jgi:hypothetical protein